MSQAVVQIVFLYYWQAGEKTRRLSVPFLLTGQLKDWTENGEERGNDMKQRPTGWNQTHRCCSEDTASTCGTCSASWAISLYFDWYFGGFFMSQLWKEFLVGKKTHKEWRWRNEYLADCACLVIVHLFTLHRLLGLYLPTSDLQVSLFTFFISVSAVFLFPHTSQRL